MGIVALDASFRCKGYSDYASNKFWQLTAGVISILNDPLFETTVDGMHFDRNLVGVYDMQGAHPIYTNNKFTAMTSGDLLGYLTMGMYIDQSIGYTIERNYFEDIDQIDPQEVRSAGIWFHGEQPADNRIYDNEFHDLTVGNVAEGVHNGTFDGVKTGLQWLCGLYEGEVIDQLLLSPDGTIKQQQGLFNVYGTAGNVFQGMKDCATTYEPRVFANHDPFPINYYFYSNTNSPDSRPECIEDVFGNPIPPVGNYYSLSEVLATVPFNAQDHCAGGVLDVPNHGVLIHKAAYEAKYAELRSAEEAYEGTLDHGLKDDVIDAIKADPPWPSHQLRTYLLSQSPLSEAVLLAAIDRVEPMDPWHLSQVLIANSRLSGAIWKELDYTGVLSTFFYNMVLEHEDDASVREVLQAEIDLRASEKDLEQRLLVLALQEDSAYTEKLDTLLAIFARDTLGYGEQVAFQLALSHQRTSVINVLMSELHADSRYDLLRAFGGLQVALNHNWSAATASQLASLATMAWSEGHLGRAAAWGTLYALGATDSLPNGRLPMEVKTMHGQERAADVLKSSTIGVYPNPAKDRLMVTYPADLKAGTLEMVDGRGGIVLSVSITGRTGFTELDVHALADGLYLARVINDGEVIGETKCAIAR